MHLISFDPFRTLGIPGVRYIKPEAAAAHRAELGSADWLLFPAYWQLHTLHYVLKRPIFPSLGSYHLGHDKVEMTRAFQTACPDHVPRTEILASTGDNIESALARFEFPFVAKTVRASQGEGVFLIENERQFRDYAAGHEVLYVQERLPIVRDLRIVLVGNDVVASYWREGTGFHNNLARGARVRLDLPVPEAAVDLVKTLAGYLDINHAGFDIAMVGDHPYLLEFNRLFGNQGVPGLQQGVADAMRRYLLGEGTPRPSGKGTSLSA